MSSSFVEDLHWDRKVETKCFCTEPGGDVTSVESSSGLDTDQAGEQPFVEEHRTLHTYDCE